MAISQTELIYLFCLAVCNALIIIGWNKATYFEWNEKELRAYSVADRYFYSTARSSITDKMVLWKLRYYAEKYLGEFWSKPFFTCPTCMASVHSTYFYWAVMPFTLHSLIIYPFYIVGLAGLTSIINNHS